MILARIQGHPSRHELHSRLRQLLHPLPVELSLHESDPPDPWMGYKRCLADIPEGVDHLVVIQDDGLPCLGFAEAVQQIAERHPNDPVCLFVGSLPSATASLVRRAKPEVRYVPVTVGSFVPLIAVLWPTHVARSFLNWSVSARGMTRADDGNAAKWARATKQQVWATVPSIVQHDDSAPSVKGGRDHVPWAESWRQTLLLAADSGSYDW